MERSYKKRALLERVMEYVFLAAACVSVLCVALICAFLLANGLPAMGEIGVLKFLSGTRWKPGADIYGIFPMIVGSVYVTAGALLLGVPMALLTAVYLAFFCPKGLYRVLKPAVELLAGIPLYGAALRSDTTDVRTVDYSRCALAVGSEGRGLSQALLAACTKTLLIPMQPHCEPLNAAVAAAVLLWEAARETI